MNTIRLEIDTRQSNIATDPLIVENIIAEGKNGSYEIIAEMLASGGESQIYRAKRLSDGEMMIAKVYTNVSNLPRERAERAAVREFLLEIESPVQYGLFPLTDTLRIQIDEDIRAEVDIMPYCADGSIGSADYGELRQIIIPGILNAMNYLHKNNFVHRDIKPENTYVLNGTVVLGDFGTMVKVSDDSRATNQTVARRGTPGYTAGEVRSGYSKTASDYFSLGCTIATLYKGGHVYSEVLESEGEGAFYNNLKQHGIPLNCPDGEADIQTLVDALTLNDENARAGYDDVMQWLKDSESFVKKWKNCRYGMNTTFKMRFRERDYFSEKDLTEAFMQNWDEALEFFYEGDMFVAYIKANSHAGCNEAERIMRNPPAGKLEKDLCFAQFLHYFNKLNDDMIPPIYWRANKYETLDALTAAIDNNICPEDIRDMFISGFVSWKFSVSNQEQTDENGLKTIREIEKRMKEQTFLSMKTFSLLLGEKKAREERGTEQIVSSVLSDKKMLYNLCVLYPDSSAGQIRGSVFAGIFAPLILKGHSADIFELERAITKEPDPIKRAIQAYLTFDEICTDKRFVRRYFHEHGPHSYLYWVVQNIDLYEVYSEGMRNTASKIKSAVFNDTVPVKTQLERFTSLKALWDEFSGNIQNSISRAAAKDMQKKTVRAREIDAHLISCGDSEALSNLLSTRLSPIGYFRTINLIPKKSVIEGGIREVLDNAASDIGANVNNINDESVQKKFSGIFSGLQYLFNQYCKYEFSDGNVLQFAIDTVNETKKGTSAWGKVILKTKSPAYFCMCLCQAVDDILKLYEKQLPEQCKKVWRELRSECWKAYGNEYENLLNSHGISYDILAWRNPDDYRPLWFNVKEKTKDVDIRTLFPDRWKALQLKQSRFDSAVKNIESKKGKKVVIQDFDSIINCAEDAKKEWDELKSAFDTYNMGVLAEFKEAKSKAGTDANYLQGEWDRYTGSILSHRTMDYERQIADWKGEKWKLQGLCRYCGGKTGVFGKCKKCGR